MLTKLDGIMNVIKKIVDFLSVVLNKYDSAKAKEEEIKQTIKKSFPLIVGCICTFGLLAIVLGIVKATKTKKVKEIDKE